MGRIRFFLLLSAIALAQSPDLVTPRKPVVDSYHGLRVRDDYRWLEDFNDPAVRDWAGQENAAARAVLDKLPSRHAIFQELVDWDSRRSPEYRDLQFRDVFFALKDGPGIQHPILVSLSSPDDLTSERTIVNPAALDPSQTTEIDFFEPSPDGRYVAVSLSRGGSEQGDVQVFDAATGQKCIDLVPRVTNGTAGGSVAWKGDGSGFYYTRYPRGNERSKTDMDFYQEIYFHRLGEPTEKDAYQLGKEFSRIAEVTLRTSPDDRYVSARVANGDGGDYEFFLLNPGGQWKQLSTFADGVADLRFGQHEDAFLLSRRGAPRGTVQHLTLDRSLTQAESVVPQSEAVIEDLLPVPSGLYVRELVGGPSRVRFFPLRNGVTINVPCPPVAAILEMARAGGDKLLFKSVSYLSPPSWYVFNPAKSAAAETALRSDPPLPLSNYEVVRDYAISKDGTKVPLSIVRQKSLTLNGENRLILTGYGGYAISEEPNFSLLEMALLQKGFTLAYANLRGGSEFGEEWHNAGKLTHKQNVFDDFAAVARHLIDARYTSPRRLGIMGGSNGGLLMGAAFTQHPDLFRAVVSFVGIYDMLRVELSSNGAFNVTEFGTVKEPDQFRALYSYSPYHHVVDGAQYPAILFLTGNNDPRVDPMQSRKMTARLQASGSRQPVLLRTSNASGHGIGTAKNERFAETADAIAFFAAQIE